MRQIVLSLFKYSKTCFISKEVTRDYDSYEVS
jgi:hypothetical protein